MTNEEKAAMRAQLDTAIEATIQAYHGFMEGTVHQKAEELLSNDWRNNLIENQAAAVDLIRGPNAQSS